MMNGGLKKKKIKRWRRRRGGNDDKEGSGGHQLPLLSYRQCAMMLKYSIRIGINMT